MKKLVNHSETTAVILAGGQANRMGEVCESLPKSMLMVGNYPFLSWVVSWLCRNNVSVVISVGHISTPIENYFNSNFWKKFSIKIIKEDSPLGTGGAIRNVAKHLNSKDFFVLNGDTILGFNIKDVKNFHSKHNMPITQIVTTKSNQNQGKILVENTGRVIDFDEHISLGKFNTPPNAIRLSSSGGYIFNREFVLAEFPETAISLELDIMPIMVRKKLAYAFRIENEIYDFGTLERYQKIKDKSLVEIYNYPLSQIKSYVQ